MRLVALVCYTSAVLAIIWAGRTGETWPVPFACCMGIAGGLALFASSAETRR